MITSKSNEQLKNLMLLQKKRKARDEQELFVCEGRRMYEEAVRYGLLVKAYFSEDYIQNISDEEKKTLNPQLTEVVKESLFREISETVSPQGVLVVLRQKRYTLSEVMKEDSTIGRLLYLDDIQDPGNLGTILRTAEAAGMDGILMSKGTVDIYNPKVVRSSMGAIFRMPFIYEIASDSHDTLMALKEAGYVLYATAMEDGVDFREAAYAEKAVLMIGNEGNGLSSGCFGMADARLTIPMHGEAESLNAAVAAALLMYEACRK